ncbi:DUF1552 domain-containing protein [Roseibacillus ishigakijimensis]|uniref:DUF1552 domain-containing protein n=2 Tax=Roseibacillus ishigakijimensis TaxID=454146 RepID=A0A934VIR1_9BACT|nr:DUF1552 domain-containing protein [Roseibacillus ishigakijimensis]
MGLGAAVGLPAFESTRSLLAASHPAAKSLATTATGAPLRMAYLYVPNGVNVAKWNSGETLAPLQEHRDQFSLINGLEVEKATSGGDGGGDHARGNAAFLTGVRPKKTAGADIALGQSVDQYAAERLGQVTRFRSLELSTDGVRKSGSCDSGYSCAYQFNLSWRSETLPMTPESNPRQLFERLFGKGSGKERAESRARRLAGERSILDFVNEDAKSLQKQLGRGDQLKLDEYLTSVREIERRIEMAERWELPEAGREAPAGIPGSYEEHLRLMFDMMLLAFETDSTRVATFLMSHEGSNRNFSHIGVPEGHHALSHHGRNEEKLAKIAKIDLFYTQQLAYFLQQAKSKKDVDGNSILDNSMILYGSAISDGDRHSHRELPIVMAGGGGGALTPGQDLTLPHDTPITNLYLRMLHEMGVPANRFGDSTGVLNYG